MERPTDFAQQWNNVQEVIDYVHQEFAQLEQELERAGSVKPESPIHATKLALAQTALDARDVYGKALHAYTELRVSELTNDARETS